MSGTMKQIAELTGVSRGTVDRVLNNRGRVSEEVEARVRRAAKELGYLTKEERLNLRHAAGINGDLSKKIGIVTQLRDASFMISIRRGFEEAARESKALGIETIVKECHGVDEQEQCRALEELERLNVDAVAIMPVECDGVRARLQHMIRDKGIKVLTFNTDISGVPRLAFIGMNNEQGGRAAAGLIGTLMRGRGSVLGIIGSFSNSTNLERINGFSQEISEHFPGITIMGVTPSMDRRVNVTEIIKNALHMNPSLGGIVMISSGQLGIRDALEDPSIKKLLAQRKDTRRPYIVIYDLTPKNHLLLEEDLADFVIDQDGFSQGYKTVKILTEILNGDDPPPETLLYTEITIRTKYTSPERHL